MIALNDKSNQTSVDGSAESLESVGMRSDKSVNLLFPRRRTVGSAVRRRGRATVVDDGVVGFGELDRS